MLLLPKLMKLLISLIVVVFIALNSVTASACAKIKSDTSSKSFHATSHVTFGISLRKLSVGHWLEEKSDFLSFENDDDDFVAVKRYVLLKTGFFCLGFVPKLFDFHSCINSDVIPKVNFTLLSSPKYVLIRNLRI
jgi:hypothetical protein